WFVELAGVRDENDVIPAIAATLQVPEGADRASIARITQSLGRTAALLVLDNCEHLIDEAAARARDLLGACPTLRILTTSREPLSVTGEIVRPIPELRLEDAVALFVERARAVAPQLYGDLDVVHDQDEIQQLCRDLDALPLAIELAAARARTM